MMGVVWNLHGLIVREKEESRALKMDVATAIADTDDVELDQLLLESERRVRKSLKVISCVLDPLPILSTPHPLELS